VEVEVVGIGITGKDPEPVWPPSNWTVQIATLSEKLRVTVWTPPGSAASTTKDVVVGDAGSMCDRLVIGSRGILKGTLKNVIVGPVCSFPGGTGQAVSSISKRRTRSRLNIFSPPQAAPTEADFHCAAGLMTIPYQP
jgi:hypothetical protein